MSQAGAVAGSTRCYCSQLGVVHHQQRWCSGIADSHCALGKGAPQKWHLLLMVPSLSIELTYGSASGIMQTCSVLLPVMPTGPRQPHWLFERNPRGFWLSESLCSCLGAADTTGSRRHWQHHVRLAAGCELPAHHRP
jgi:hypothetical protein